MTMTQTVRTTTYVVLLSISMVLFANGMIMVHEAKASTMDHSNAMDTSSNAVCQATSCAQKHFICENHCVSLPKVPEQEEAILFTQTIFNTASVASTPAILIRGPTKTKPRSIFKSSSMISQIQTVIKRE